MTEERAAYRVKPNTWAEPTTVCCPAFGVAITSVGKAADERMIRWNSAKPSFMLADQRIAFCPFCGANVTAVPE